MTHSEIREKFLKFFESRGHKIVPSSSLLPTDPSVLFTTAGMQQFKPYYTGQADAMKDFGSLNTASVQKSMRTSDIDEVGDESHLTFFEMLGNFSFGGYWKKEAIEFGYDFITKEMGLKIDYVSVFEGLPSAGVPADDESKKIWKSLDPNIIVKKADINDNFWGPTGSEGPCGPTTEIYVKGLEIWNIVFNEFYYPGSREELLSGKSPKKLEKLKTSGIDTGMGLERLAMVVQKKKNLFETDLFESFMHLISSKLSMRIKRIVADHARAIVFLIADGVRPSNKNQGYVLRRLIRRLIVHVYNIGGVGSFSSRDEALSVSPEEMLSRVIDEYKKNYESLDRNVILGVFNDEWAKFQKASRGGLQELEKLNKIDNTKAFYLYESFGLPYEAIKELGGAKAEELTRRGFDEEFKKHQEISRAGAKKKFGGHGLLLNTGELNLSRLNLDRDDGGSLKKVTRLHTATHLLHAALRKIFGEEVKQQGSDITPERLRFDFTFPRKLTSKELRGVEDMVNDVIKKELPVTKTEMSYEDAIKSGALAFFKQKYPEKVMVYSVGSMNNSPSRSGELFSRELCGGPHVSNTAEIGRFKIIKEEPVSAGVRRIRAIVE